MSTVPSNSQAWFKVSSFDHYRKVISKHEAFYQSNTQVWDRECSLALTRTGHKLDLDKCGIWVSENGEVCLMARLLEPLHWTSLLLTAVRPRNGKVPHSLPEGKTSGNFQVLFFPIGLIGPDSPHIAMSESVRLAIQITKSYKEEVLG